jgi:hypothetical protein
VTTQVNGVKATGSSIKTQENWFDTVTFGENIKGWRELLRDGQSATTTMSGSKIVAKYTPGYGRFEISKQGLLPTSFYLVEEFGSHRLTSSLPGNPSGLSETKANAEAMGKFLRKYREKITAFQGGVFLGELAQTLAMIRNPAKGLRGLVDESRDVLSNIRRLGLKNSLSRSRVTEQLADAWLELQFGWKPLLNDVDDGCKALSILNTGQRLSTARITASHTVENAFPESGYTKFGDNNIALWRTASSSENAVMVIYRGAMRVRARNPAEMRSDLLGFSPDNFAPTIWELIPYSFLIDYFSNVGDIIEGWSLLDLPLAWCNKTVRKSNTAIRRSFSDPQTWNEDKPFVNPPTLVSLTFSPAKNVTTWTSVTRVKYEQAMVPDFTFRVPSLGSLRWLNIAALIASRNGDRNWIYD